MIQRIVSGGQTGADRAALDWAIANGIPHGGWCLKGRKALDGPLNAKYQLKETPSAGYLQRNEWNVRDSDGTVVFTLSATAKGGSAKTISFAEKQKKPWIHLHPGVDAAALLTAFVKEHAIVCLNVAGSWESKEPGLYVWVESILKQSLPTTIQPEPFSPYSAVLALFPEKMRPIALESLQFRETLSPESDRGSALMAGAFLDNKLRTLIEAKLVAEPKVVERFLEFNGAAGTFSSRIDFCYLTGLIPKSVYYDLHLIRKIRNLFGHRVDSITFETQEIRSRCQQLEHRNVPDDSRSRLKFTNACFGVLAIIDGAIFSKPRFSSPKDNVWTKEEKAESRAQFEAAFEAVLKELSPDAMDNSEIKAKVVAAVASNSVKSKRSGNAPGS